MPVGSASQRNPRRKKGKSAWETVRVTSMIIPCDGQRHGLFVRFKIGGEGRNRTYPPALSCRGNGFEDRDDHQARITLLKLKAAKTPDEKAGL